MADKYVFFGGPFALQHTALNSMDVRFLSPLTGNNISRFHPSDSFCWHVTYLTCLKFRNLLEFPFNYLHRLFCFSSKKIEESFKFCKTIITPISKHIKISSVSYAWEILQKYMFMLSLADVWLLRVFYCMKPQEWKEEHLCFLFKAIRSRLYIFLDNICQMSFYETGRVRCINSSSSRTGSLNLAP